VQEPKGWKPFVENDDDFLWFCLAVRDSGIAGSRRLNIKDDVDAWAFDLAITHRLYLYDRQQNKVWAKYQGYQVLRMWAGKEDDDPDNE
jgi:hypothetical protein